MRDSGHERKLIRAEKMKPFLFCLHRECRGEKSHQRKLNTAGRFWWMASPRHNGPEIPPINSFTDHRSHPPKPPPPTITLGQKHDILSKITQHRPNPPNPPPSTMQDSLVHSRVQQISVQTSFKAQQFCLWTQTLVEIDQVKMRQ